MAQSKKGHNIRDNASPSPSSEPRGLLNYRYFAAFAVALVAFFFYLPAANGLFVNWDDGLYIAENPAMLSAKLRTLKWYLTAVVAANWHPLTMLSYAMDINLWGAPAARGFHLTNVFLHALNTGLVFLVSLKLFGLALVARENDKKAFWGSAITALLFALHPLHVESVAWISERKDVLYSFFFLIGVGLYLRYVHGERPRLWYALSLFAFILSLLSKPMAVTMPALLLILDYYPLKRLSLRSLLEKAPFFALSLASSITTVWAQKTGGALMGLEAFPLGTRVLVAFRAYAFYVYKTFLPTNLAPLYPYPKDIGAGSLEALGSIVFFMAASAAAIYLVKKSRLYLALWLYFVTALLPVIGIIQVGAQPAADRYMYLPGLALFMGASALFVKLSGGKVVQQAALASIAVIIIFGHLTVKQIGRWHDPLSLWSYAISVYPDVPVAHNNLGDFFYHSGKYKEALPAFDKAIEIDPAYAKAHYNRGDARFKLGDLNGALADYSKAIELNPGFAEAYYNRGTTYGEFGEYKLAIADYDAAISLKPSHAKAYNNRANAYLRLGMAELAVADYTAALAGGPSAVFLNNRGVAFMSLGDNKRAAADFVSAIKLDPKSPQAHFNLGRVLWVAGDRERAVAIFKKAASLGSKEAATLLANGNRPATKTPGRAAKK
jgi:tetratricopeptide (TPR) repeat protein